MHLRQDRTFMRTCIRTLWVTPRPWRQTSGGKERTNRSVEKATVLYSMRIDWLALDSLLKMGQYDWRLEGTEWKKNAILTKMYISLLCDRWSESVLTRARGQSPALHQLRRRQQRIWAVTRAKRLVGVVSGKMLASQNGSVCNVFLCVSQETSTSSSPLSTPSSSAVPSRSPSSTSGLSSGFMPSPSPSQSSRAFQNMLGQSWTGPISLLLRAWH